MGTETMRPAMSRRALALLALGVAAGFGAPAHAQDNYPSRQVTIIAPFAAGGSADIVSRIIAARLAARLGQNVIVDNKPGGNSVIGIREAIKARPGGYTLLLGAVGAHGKTSPRPHA